MNMDLRAQHRAIKQNTRRDGSRKDMTEKSQHILAKTDKTGDTETGKNVAW